MIDKSTLSMMEVLSKIKDGSTIMIGDFGTADGSEKVNPDGGAIGHPPGASGARNYSVEST